MTLTLSYHCHPWQFYYQTLWLSIIVRQLSLLNLHIHPGVLVQQSSCLPNIPTWATPDRIHSPEPVLWNWTVPSPYHSDTLPCRSSTPVWKDQHSLGQGASSGACSTPVLLLLEYPFYLFLFRFNCHSQEQVLVYHVHWLLPDLSLFPYPDSPAKIHPTHLLSY